MTSELVTGPGAADVLLAREAGHANPMFDYLTGFVPRKLKDLFRWAEYLVHASAHLYAVIKKFGEYPITRFVYDTSAESERKRYKDLFEKHLRLKGFLTEVSFDKYTYGNCFISMYEPFRRELECKYCPVKTGIRFIDYKYNADKALFTFTCPSCKRESSVSPTDTKLNDPSKLHLIRWDPKLMDISHNPITNESVFYYTIPDWMKVAIKRGDRNLVNTMPADILQCIAKNRTFEFAPGQIYHLKVPGLAGIESHWGYPPITAAIKLFLFVATLRKANEAIALEHIAPMRVFYPQASSPAGDPISTINLAEWRSQLEANYRRFRRDPLHIMFSPTPIGLQDIGGQGRALLTLGEVEAAEKNIILSMGVPMEFLSGGLGQTRGEITLRMIENQLQTHIEDLNGVIQWIADKCAKFLSYTPIETRLADFKMIDDVDNKQLLLQLFQAGELPASDVFEALGKDPVQVRKQLKEEQIAKARFQQDVQTEVQKVQSSLSAQSQAQAAMQQGQGMNYDQQAVYAAAQQQAEQLANLPDGERRSQLHSLQTEDWVLYSCVIQLLEQMRLTQAAQAKSMSQQQGPAQGPAGPMG